MQRRLAHPTDDENLFVPIALELLRGIWHEGMHVRLAGLGMSGFSDADAPVQADLFEDLDERGAVSSNRRELSVAVDRLRERFGADAVAYGRAARFKDDIVRRDKYKDV